jgi:hypothetical protein
MPNDKIDLVIGGSIFYLKRKIWLVGIRPSMVWHEMHFLIQARFTASRKKERDRKYQDPSD